MRALKYKLADGTIVNTLAEAQASGQTWVTVLETVQRQGVWGTPGALFFLSAPRTTEPRRNFHYTTAANFCQAENCTNF